MKFFRSLFVLAMLLPLTVAGVAKDAAAKDEPPTPVLKAATAVVGEYRNTQVHLWWDVTTDKDKVRGFEIYRDDQLVADIHNNLLLGKYVWIDNKINKGETGSHSYKIRSYTKNGANVLYSANSTESIVRMVDKDDASPSTPTGIILLKNEPSSIKIGWNESLDTEIATGSSFWDKWAGGNVYYTFAVDGMPLKGRALENHTTLKNVPPGKTFNISVTAHDWSNNPSNRSMNLTVTSLPKTSLSYKLSNYLARIIPGGKQGNGDLSEVYHENERRDSIKEVLNNATGRLKELSNLRLADVLAGKISGYVESLRK
jgi:hypothetical protein